MGRACGSCHCAKSRSPRDLFFYKRLPKNFTDALTEAFPQLPGDDDSWPRHPETGAYLVGPHGLPVNAASGYWHFGARAYAPGWSLIHSVEEANVPAGAAPIWIDESGRIHTRSTVKPEGYLKTRLRVRRYTHPDQWQSVMERWYTSLVYHNADARLTDLSNGKLVLMSEGTFYWTSGWAEDIAHVECFDLNNGGERLWTCYLNRPDWLGDAYPDDRVQGASWGGWGSFSSGRTAYPRKIRIGPDGSVYVMAPVVRPSRFYFATEVLPSIFKLDGATGRRIGWYGRWDGYIRDPDPWFAFPNVDKVGGGGDFDIDENGNILMWKTGYREGAPGAGLVVIEPSEGTTEDSGNTQKDGYGAENMKEGSWLWWTDTPGLTTDPFYQAARTFNRVVFGSSPSEAVSIYYNHWANPEDPRRGQMVKISGGSITGPYHWGWSPYAQRYVGPNTLYRDWSGWIHTFGGLAWNEPPDESESSTAASTTT